MKKILLMGGFLASFLMSFAQVPSYVPTDGLVGYWPFNGNANDESGNGNDGVVNGAIITSDRFEMPNSAYFFDGNSQITCSISQIPVLNESRSFCFWVKQTGEPVSGSGAGSIFNYGVVSSNRRFGCMYWPHEPMIVAQGNDACYGCSGSQPHQDVSSLFNNWHFVAITFDGQEVKCYVNSVLYFSANTTYNTDFSNLIIGMGFPNHEGGERFVGVIDDFGVWERAISQEEITQLNIGCNVLPTTIAGNVSPVTLASADYSCNNNPGSTYQWTVTNGVITAGQGTSTVTVLWGEEGVGTLTVTETNSDGCSGAPVTINVDVICSTTATSIDGPLGPNALTSTTYTCNGSSTSAYQWTISNGVITSGQGTNTVTVLWAGTGLGSISVQETTNANCTGDVISIDVVVIPTGVEEQENAMLVFYPNPASQFFTMEFGSSYIAAGYSIQILNTIGQNVLSKKVMNNREVIDVSTWPAGNYLISVLNDKGTEVETKTIVIQ